MNVLPAAPPARKPREQSDSDLIKDRNLMREKLEAMILYRGYNDDTIPSFARQLKNKMESSDPHFPGKVVYEVAQASREVAMSGHIKASSFLKAADVLSQDPDLISYGKFLEENLLKLAEGTLEDSSIQLPQLKSVGVRSPIAEREYQDRMRRGSEEWDREMARKAAEQSLSKLGAPDEWESGTIIDNTFRLGRRVKNWIPFLRREPKPRGNEPETYAKNRLDETMERYGIHPGDRDMVVEAMDNYPLGFRKFLEETDLRRRNTGNFVLGYRLQGIDKKRNEDDPIYLNKKAMEQIKQLQEQHDADIANAPISQDEGKQSRRHRFIADESARQRKVSNLENASFEAGVSLPEGVERMGEDRLDRLTRKASRGALKPTKEERRLQHKRDRRAGREEIDDGLAEMDEKTERPREPVDVLRRPAGRGRVAREHSAVAPGSLTAEDLNQAPAGVARSEGRAGEEREVPVVPRTERGSGEGTGEPTVPRTELANGEQGMGEPATTPNALPFREVVVERPPFREVVIPLAPERQPAAPSAERPLEAGPLPPVEELGLPAADLKLVREQRSKLDEDPNSISPHTEIADIFTRYLQSHDSEITPVQRKNLVRMAVAELQAASAKDTGSYHTYPIGQSYEQLGMYDEAVAEYRRALERSPSSIFLHRMVGNVYEKQDKPAEALREYETAGNKQPTAPEPDLWVGQFYEHQNIFPLAAERLQTASKKAGNQPKQVHIHIYVAEAFDRMAGLTISAGLSDELRQRMQADAVAELNTAFQLAGDDKYTHFEIASAHDLAGRLDAAIAGYQKTLEIGPEYSFAKQNLESCQKRKPQGVK